ncbi:transketolase family protein [archaeon]|nr:transketolase family protein [archaeon]
MNGKLKSQRESFGEAILEAGRKNDNIYVFTSDLGGPTKVKEFAKEFPERFGDLGIAEQHAISFVGGAALAGLRPFYTTFGVFAASNYGQIRQSIAYSKAPVVIVGTHAGLIGKDGASHQALEEIALMSSLPGMNVLQPADDIETKQIVNFLANNNMTAYLRLSRHPQENVHDENYQFGFNKATKLMESPEPKIAIFSTGYMSTHALDAAKKLSKEGISIEVVNFSTLNPIDKEMVNGYKDKGIERIYTLEDHNINGGLGSRICEIVAEDGIATKVTRLGMNTFGTSGSPNDLYKKFGLDVESIANKISEDLKPDL